MGRGGYDGPHVTEAPLHDECGQRFILGQEMSDGSAGSLGLDWLINDGGTLDRYDILFGAAVHF